MNCVTRWALVAAALLPMTGCSMVKDELNFSLDSNTTKTMTIPAVKKVKVSFTAEGAPVNIYIVPKKDEEATQNALDSGKKLNDVLQKWEKAENGEAEIVPSEKTELVVFIKLAVTGNKKATVNIKFKGA